MLFRTSTFIFCTQCYSRLMVNRAVIQESIKSSSTFLRSIKHSNHSSPLSAAVSLSRFHTSSILGHDGEDLNGDYVNKLLNEHFWGP